MTGGIDMYLHIGTNERASLDRPAWNQTSGWNAFNHLHRQGRAFTIKRGRHFITHVKDNRVINFFNSKTKGDQVWNM